MIFPPIRISDLERDLEFKREVFLTSRDELFQIGKEKLNPKNLFKNDPKSFFGFGAGLAIFGTVLFTFGKLLGFCKKGPIWSLIKTGWILSFAQWGAGKIFKFFLPFAFLGIKKWMGKTPLETKPNRE